MTEPTNLPALTAGDRRQLRQLELERIGHSILGLREAGAEFTRRGMNPSPREGARLGEPRPLLERKKWRCCLAVSRHTSGVQRRGSQ